MLVLTRKKNQTIMLGEGIKITLLEIAPDGVKIGIDAPRNLLILRGELLQAVRDENLAARHNDSAAADFLQFFRPK